jgi:hypothetical protein
LSTTNCSTDARSSIQDVRAAQPAGGHHVRSAGQVVDRAENDRCDGGIADVGDHAARRVLEFFAAQIRNRNTDTEPLHGLTFALLYLADMRVLAETVPPRLAATPLTLYGTFGIGAAVALLTLVSPWSPAKQQRNHRSDPALAPAQAAEKAGTPVP